MSGPGADLFKIACENELEGIVSKRLDRAYRSGRSRDWLKTKCALTDAFVIIGYQPGPGASLRCARPEGRRRVWVSPALRALVAYRGVVRCHIQI